MKIKNPLIILILAIGTIFTLLANGYTTISRRTFIFGDKLFFIDVVENEIDGGAAGFLYKFKEKDLTIGTDDMIIAFLCEKLDSILGIHPTNDFFIKIDIKDIKVNWDKVIITVACKWYSGKKSYYEIWFDGNDIVNIIQRFKLNTAQKSHKLSCWANIDLIKSAVETYNMMVPPSEMMRNLDLSILVKHGYLKKFPKCPDGGFYTNSEDLTKGGLIICTKHGAPGAFRKCMKNIRLIQSAVELYNMDVPGKDMMHILDLDILVRYGYLKEYPKCPEGGYYREIGDLTTTGFVSCTKHGSPAYPKQY